MSVKPIDELLAIMVKLRDPNGGCPWDLKQRFDTIVPHTIEEVYEVADAIERQDWQELREELGDLLFQIIFYSQLAKEDDLFSFEDVVTDLNDKLVRRHPHVFADRELADESALNASWEQEKAAEREEKGQQSVLDNIPNAFPALIRADKIQKRVARHGFDWDSFGPVVDKVHEEIDEVMAEVMQVSPDADRIEDEVGDLLFAAANLARHAGVKPEMALARANKKFERRFRQVEKNVLEQGKRLDECDLETLEAHWQAVKKREKNNAS
ncbi:nucleoside triphosphate pyrophosphohydrolase [Thaumasiovibrio subtropicus]|uniref:nucleoside triphosphate pyrophosphohydrolase n=1 Tax=Thaumasiovibrio subtropicus TaxID=1891207 RepID=UPI000B363976|nr:nucleoside triphosphate pyrophosphohydrolase [Thaumasiovibrio subtropicus]